METYRDWFCCVAALCSIRVGEEQPKDQANGRNSFPPGHDRPRRPQRRRPRRHEGPPVQRPPGADPHRFLHPALPMEAAAGDGCRRPVERRRKRFLQRRQDGGAAVHAAPSANRRRPLRLRRATTALGIIDAAQAGRAIQLVPSSGLEGAPTEPSRQPWCGLRPAPLSRSGSPRSRPGTALAGFASTS